MNPKNVGRVFAITLLAGCATSKQNARPDPRDAEILKLERQNSLLLASIDSMDTPIQGLKDERRRMENRLESDSLALAETAYELDMLDEQIPGRDEALQAAQDEMNKLQSQLDGTRSNVSRYARDLAVAEDILARHRALRHVLDSREGAQYALEHPDSMEIGEVGRATLKLSLDLDTLMLRKLLDSSKTIITGEVAEVSPSQAEVRVELSGPGFEVEAIGSKTMDIAVPDPGSPRTWSWNIIPKEGSVGYRSLTLSIETVVTKENGKDQYNNVGEPIDRTIYVYVVPPSLSTRVMRVVGAFVTDWLPELLLGLALAIGGVFIGEWRERRKGSGTS